MINRIILITLLCIVLFGGSNNGEKDIPMTRFSQNVGAPTMTFLYCYSCGYRRAFEDYVNLINDKYPEIMVNGENYSPSVFHVYLSKLILYGKLMFMVLILATFNIWTYFGIGIPSWYQWCCDNKMYACMMVYFLGNTLEQTLVSSGAFEISLNDVPIWSKLDTGRIPAPPELFQIIESQLQFTNDNFH